MTTIKDLHAIGSFPALFDDPRLKSALAHLRERGPKERGCSGQWQGWHDCLDTLESLKAQPGPDNQQKPKLPPYSQPEPPNK